MTMEPSTAGGPISGARNEPTSTAMDELDTFYCRFIDSVVNHRRLDDLDQFLAADVVEHAPVRTVGLDAARQTLAD
jgi:hypothetical protein